MITIVTAVSKRSGRVIQVTAYATYTAASNAYRHIEKALGAECNVELRTLEVE